MKTIQFFFFGVVSIFCFENTKAQQLNESFEGNTFPPPGWSISNVQGPMAWISSTAESHTGSASAFIDYEFTGPGEDWLKTPQIFSIQNGDNVSFWVKNPDIQAFPPANLEILVSTTNNQNASFTNSIGNIDISTLLSGGWVHYTYSLNAFAGQNIFIAFKHTDDMGSGLYLDDITGGSLLMNDAASKGIKVTPLGIATPGTALTIVDTIRNAGSNTLSAGIPVKYNINNGSVFTGSTTSASIIPGATTTISFSYIPPSAGIYIIKVFSALAGDIHGDNDTVIYTLNVQSPISAFPFFENFSNPSNWTTAGTADWDMVRVINPAGLNNDNAARARFFNTPFGKVFYLRSPLFDFTSNAKPMLDFYVAYRSVAKQNDRLEVVVSTDGGVTFQALPVLYNKSYTTRLSTIGNDTLGYSPASSYDWRHEAVDLSAYSSVPNVLIAFKATSAVGNNLYVDNVNVINQNSSLYTTTTITTPAQIATGPFNTKVKFNTIGNASGGIVQFQGSSVLPPVNTFYPNTSATSNDGTITSPDFIYPQYSTITYTGNDSVRANYDISLDITGLGVLSPDKTYIVKRSDQSGLWIAYPTTRVGNILTATGFSKFSDFGIATYLSTLPLSLITFNGRIKEEKINLSWQTTNQTNITGFDIERMTGSNWIKIGSIQSSGNASGTNNYSFSDNIPAMGINYYRLKIIDVDGKYTYSQIVNFEFKLNKPVVYQNVPNPFTASTIIRYDLVERSPVKIVVYNVDGIQIKVLVNELKDAGSYQVKWNAANLPAGNYYYKVIIANGVITKKMLKFN
ncbi:MAG TPA: choice-of-anchor J domain-containing protein [Chitinophagaceae bacterium]|nr:choice-of-anchor J domain-containing protein [Chitinophagaceae bacterium]